MTARCAARPDDLHRAALDLERLADELGSALRSFDAAIAWFEAVQAGPFAVLRQHDPLGVLPGAVADLAAWVDAVALAFAAAGAGTSEGAVVVADRRAIDGWMASHDWHPGGHLQPADSSREWFDAVVGLGCAGFTGAGYLGRGFLVGPDGERYPLVAPWVERGGVRYQADGHASDDRLGVLDLDGRDQGWTTIAELTGVERWRAEPDGLERALIGIGSTAAGPPRGSTETDVQRVLLVPFGAPVLASVPPDRSPRDAATSTYDPLAPEHAPPHAPDLQYPRGQGSVGGSAALALPVAVDLAAGVADADRGSFAAYDVVFQRNADGRTRALYKRVFVGEEDDGSATLTSAWVTGPERNDHVVINYAPGG